MLRLVALLIVLALVCGVIATFLKALSGVDGRSAHARRPVAATSSAMFGRLALLFGGIATCLILLIVFVLEQASE